MTRARRTWPVLTAWGWVAAVSVAGAERDAGARVLDALEQGRESFAQVAKQIWSFAEVGYQEQKSSALLQSELKAAGFTVKAGVAEIPTAFVATWGTGKPVIGIVGEFDALPGLSQDATPTRKPIAAGA